MTDELRIAVLGVGMMGAFHVEALSKRVRGAKITVINDYFLVRVDSFTAEGTLNEAELRAENLTGHRWWTLDELLAYQGPALFAPRALPRLLQEERDREDVSGALFVERLAFDRPDRSAGLEGDPS